MSIHHPRTLDLLASCLDYPGPGAAPLARDAASGLASTEPELSSALFDINPVCTLHVGYHVFGESYARGEFLAALAAELRTAGVGTRGDLPDYLPTMLRLLGRIEQDDDRRSLRQLALLPALRKIATALARSTDPWSGLLRALPGALREASDPAAAPEPDLRMDGAGHGPSACSASCGVQPSPSW